MQRADKPQGYGPLPNTVTYAENFNQFSAAINLLDKARVSLPMSFECRKTTYTGDSTTVPDYEFGGPASCVHSGVNKAVTSMTPPAATVSGGSSGWKSCRTFNAVSFGGFNETAQCQDATNWNTHSLKEILDFRLALTDPLSAHAIPATWRDMLQTSAMGVIGRRNKTTTVASYETVTPAEAEECCVSPPCPFLTLAGFSFKFSTTTTAIIDDECQLIQTGQLDPGDPLAGDFWVGRAGDGSECGTGSDGYDSFVPIVDQPEGFIKIPLT